MTPYSKCPRLRCIRTTALVAAMSLPVISMVSVEPAHPGMAPIGRYLMGKAQEIDLARSAAPASLSSHASVMVLGNHGYVTAVKGSNGFVCLVARSWDNRPSVNRARFWNSKSVIPYCFNPAGARSLLAEYLMKTRWALAGLSERKISARIKAAWSEGKFKEPQSGAMSYMLSNRAQLDVKGVPGPAPGPWRPHLMFYVPNRQVPPWGENLPGSPVLAHFGEHVTVFFVLVPYWSDGTPAPK